MASLTAHSPSLMQACSSRTASKGATKLCSPLLPSLRCVPAPACVQPAAAQAQQQQCQRAGQRRAAVAVRAEPEGGASTSTMPPPESDWVAVCRPEDLPKGAGAWWGGTGAGLRPKQHLAPPFVAGIAGVRKELEIDGRQVLLFWYRNQIYCTQARSPAEGAYSEGFIKAKFTQVGLRKSRARGRLALRAAGTCCMQAGTHAGLQDGRQHARRACERAGAQPGMRMWPRTTPQDYCIECPSTGSLFSLNDGSIKSWYPNNSVLRALTPQDTCPPLEVRAKLATHLAARTTRQLCPRCVWQHRFRLPFCKEHFCKAFREGRRRKRCCRTQCGHNGAG